MNKYFLFRKASVIHAIKCNTTADFNIAEQSFNRLSELKTQISSTEALRAFEEINGYLNDWAGENPIATEGEINKLVNKKY